MDAVSVSLPKTDIHWHAEVRPRLDLLIARRTGRRPHDWREWLRQVSELPPGMPRLGMLNGDFFRDDESRYETDFVVWLADALENAAQDGAALVEIRFRPTTVLVPEFMSIFREAEQGVCQGYPGFCAEATISLFLGRPETAEAFEGCLRAREEGLAGIDFIPTSYNSEADWTEAYRWAERAANAGLGITVHAGEFSTANVAAALRVPGLTLIGHGVYAAYDEDLLEQVAQAGVTVECCLTSNVVLGAVTLIEAHPIRKFLEAGVPVTLNTDNPVRMCTSIEQEYQLAATLGFSENELLAFTRNGIAASFTTEERKAALLGNLRAIGVSDGA
ncbi:MAG: hypothetical protein L0177_03815 [Chloroflexi bacterium]|nr:hypothetical protein [Chloroflexota bacterium]